MDRSHGIAPADLDDDEVRRELAHLHETRHDALISGSRSAFDTHTERMLALEREYLRRFPQDAGPDPMRTRAGSRANAGQPVPGRDPGGRSG